MGLQTVSPGMQMGGSSLRETLALHKSIPKITWDRLIPRMTSLLLSDFWSTQVLFG